MDCMIQSLRLEINMMPLGSATRMISPGSVIRSIAAASIDVLITATPIVALSSDSYIG